MPTIKYELGKTNAKGDTPIYIRLSQKRQLKRIRFDVDAAPGDITAKGKIKNVRLEKAVQDQILRYKQKLIVAGSDVKKWDVDKMYTYLITEEKTQLGFDLDFFEFGYKHIGRLKNDGEIKTAHEYEITLKNFQKFIGTDKIDINCINKNVLLDYKEWLKKQGVAAKTCERYTIDLQSLHNHALHYDDEVDETQNLDSMWSGFNDRIEDICHFYRIQKKCFAEQLGIDNRRLSLPKGTGQHTIAYLIMLHYPEINARWLLFGKGNMFEKEYEGETLSRGGRSIAIPRQHDAGNRIATEEYVMFEHPDINKSDNDVIFGLRTENENLKNENKIVWQRYDTAQQEIGRLKDLLKTANVPL